MKNLKLGLFSLGVLFSSTASWAGLALSSINTMNVTMYGMYTTSDPLCQTGLTATIPVSATGSTYNLVLGPTLGSGAVSSSIACVVILMKNTVGYGWAAGSYTSSSNQGSDSVCNAGGTSNAIVCRGNNVNNSPVTTTLTYPTQVATDAAKAGLTLATSCSQSSTGTEVVPLYISTYALCTGQTTADTAAGNASTCVSNGGSTNMVFQAPTAASDAAHGAKLTAPTSAASYTFKVDPTSSVGNSGNSACGSTSPPLFSLTN